MSKWLVTQPIIGDEIVIFVNHSMPSYHVIKWQDLKSNNNDWDVYLKHGTYVGPRNFKGGAQFSDYVEDKEFYWMHKDTFLKKIS